MSLVTFSAGVKECMELYHSSDFHLLVVIHNETQRKRYLYIYICAPFAGLRVETQNMLFVLVVAKNCFSYS